MADGKGIDFSADASPASGMTAEILDDYEEGTFTAAVNATSNGSSNCYYTKIGRLVTIHIYYYSATWTDGTGNLALSGLPFTAANVSNYPAVVGQMINFDFDDSTQDWWSWRVQPNTDYLILCGTKESASQTIQTVDTNQTNVSFMLSGSYIAA